MHRFVKGLGEVFLFSKSIQRNISHLESIRKQIIQEAGYWCTFTFADAPHKIEKQQKYVAIFPFAKCAFYRKIRTFCSSDTLNPVSKGIHTAVFEHIVEIVETMAIKTLPMAFKHLIHLT